MASSYDAVLLGGSGTLARALLRKLSAQGARVLVFSRSKPEVEGPRIEWRNWESSATLTEAKTAIYIAGVRGHFEANSQEYFEQGRVSAPDFGELFLQLSLSARRLITIGSSAEYGARPDDTPIDEYDPLRPVSSYGHWKVILGRRGREWAERRAGTHIHLRPFMLYDLEHLDRGMFLGEMLKTLASSGTFRMTGGEQWRSFCHVDTAVEVIGRLLERPHWPERVMNVSEDHYWQLREMAKRCHAVLKTGTLAIGSLPYRTNEVWHQRPSLKRMKTFLWSREERALRG